MNALIAIMAALVLLALVLMVCVLILFHRTKGDTNRKFLSVTSFLSMTSQVAALVWVSCSYAFAGYATIALGQPFPSDGPVQPGNCRPAGQRGHQSGNKYL